MATVSSSGAVKAVGEGTAQIIATTDNGLSASVTIEVTPLPRQVSLAASAQTATGYVYQLEPTVTPANATTTYTWETADPKVAAVDDMGRVTGRNAGTTTITVTTANGKTATCQVRVKAPSEGMDHRNVGVRTRALKELINKSFIKEHKIRKTLRL